MPDSLVEPATVQNRGPKSRITLKLDTPANPLGIPLPNASATHVLCPVIPLQKNIGEFKLKQHPTTLVTGSGCGADIGGGGGW